MNQEDIKKALDVLGGATINVAGDFVLEKNNTYNIEKVEPGGIGMQFVNGQQSERTEGKKGKNTVDLPSRDQMVKAVNATFSQGYWWSSRSWAVVYRVYQMKGYMANVSQFVREVKEWNVRTNYKCTYDAVQKPMASGSFIGTLDKWEAQGAQGQAKKLAEALLKELTN